MPWPRTGSRAGLLPRFDGGVPAAPVPPRRALAGGGASPFHRPVPSAGDRLLHLISSSPFNKVPTRNIHPIAPRARATPVEREKTLLNPLGPQHSLSNFPFPPPRKNVARPAPPPPRPPGARRLRRRARRPGQGAASSRAREPKQGLGFCVSAPRGRGAAAPAIAPGDTLSPPAAKQRPKMNPPLLPPAVTTPTAPAHLRPPTPPKKSHP